MACERWPETLRQGVLAQMYETCHALPPKTEELEPQDPVGRTYPAGVQHGH